MTLAERVSRFAERPRLGWALFAVALAARLGLGFGLLDPYSAPVDDELVYQKFAESIVERGEIALVPGQPTAERMPGYLAFLAAARWVAGPNLLVPRLMQVLIGSLTPVGLWLITRRVAGPVAGLLAGLAASLDPFLIFYDYRIFSETLAVAAVVWTLAYFLSVGRNLDVRRAVVGGMIGTLGLYFRPDLAVLLAAICAWAVFAIRPIGRAFSICLILVLVPAALLVPWGLRNLRAVGRFVPMTTNSGLVLWQCNNEETLHDPELRGFWYPWPGHPEARGFKVGPDFTTDPRFQDVHGEVEIDARLKELVWDFWRENWRELPGYALAKWRRIFAITPAFSAWPPIFVTVSRIWYSALFSLGALGLGVLAARRAQIGILCSYLGLIFVRTAMLVMIFRHRLQIEPVLLLFAAAGAAWLLERMAPRAASSA